jgi:hypothetical protein
MTLLIQNLFRLERLTIALQENLPLKATQNDLLIAARGLQTWQYIGIAALAIGAIVIVGIFSPRVEHAIAFAIILSLVLIAFFLATLPDPNAYSCSTSNDNSHQIGFNERI